MWVALEMVLPSQSALQKLQLTPLLQLRLLVYLDQA